MVPVRATVDPDHLELGVQHAVAVGSPSRRVVDEQAQDRVFGELFDVLRTGGSAVPEVLPSPPARLSVPADSVEGTALICAEVTD